MIELIMSAIHCAAKAQDSSALGDLYRFLIAFEETPESKRAKHYIKTILDSEYFNFVEPNGLQFYDDIEELALDYELAKVPISDKRFIEDILDLCHNGYVYADYHNPIDLIRQEGVSNGPTCNYHSF